MAGKRFYEPVGGDLTLWADPKDFVKADLEAEVVELEFLMAQGDPVRERLGSCSGFQTLEAYDAYLFTEWSRKKDIIDFFDYSNTTLELTVKDGEWFLPEAIEAICGEEIGFEGSKMIDDDWATYWQHDDNEAHEVDLRVRDYKKRMTKIRIRRSANPRSALNNLDVYVADNILQLDNPANLAATGVSISTDNDWNEIVFSSSKRGKYIRLTGFGSAHATNEVRIREIEAWVVTVEYD